MINAKRGYFALQDYAVQCWYDHLLEWADPSAPADPSAAQTLARLGGLFLGSYGLVSKVGEQSGEVMAPVELRAAIHAIPKDDRERNSGLNIEDRTLGIRKCIEMLRDEQLSSDEEEVLDNLYGPWKTYKCSKPWCGSFTRGMKTAEEREKHSARHELPFRCHSEACFAYSLGFDDASKLSQHKSRYHGTSDELAIDFPSFGPKKALTLHVAAKKGSIQMVTAILDTGVDINSLNWSYSIKNPHHYQTALSTAAERGHIEICKLLISRGALCYLGQDGESALEGAISAANMELVILLLSGLKAQETLRQVPSRAITVAIDGNRTSILKVLLQYGDIQTEERHVLDAMGIRKRGVLEELVKHNVYKVFLNQQLINKALRRDFDHSIETVLAAGLFDITGDDEILLALQKGRVSTAEILLGYRKLQVSDIQLKRCRDIAHEKAFDHVVAVIDGMKGLQRKLLSKPCLDAVQELISFLW